MVGVLLSPFVQKPIGVDHIVDDAALVTLLALEPPLSRQVVTTVFIEMVVRCGEEGLVTCIHEELCKGEFEFGLAGRLRSEGLATLNQFDDT